jgi:FG-GAP repeat
MQSARQWMIRSLAAALLATAFVGLLSASSTAAVCAGGTAPSDFNGDGYSDLVVGSYGEDLGTGVGAGTVTVIYGSPTGLNTSSSQVWSQDTPGVPGESNPIQFFGYAHAAGDFDGDGCDDLAIGVPGEWPSDGLGGIVHVLRGSPAGLTAEGTYLVPRRPLDRDRGDDEYGRALASGDLNGDGIDDLLIDAAMPSVNGGNGAVFRALGGPSGLATATFFFYGKAVAIGDVNGDGIDDAVMGAPNVGDLDQGEVVLRISGVSGFVHLTQDTVGAVGVAEPLDRFGAAVAVGDLDADGFADVAVGIPGEEFSSGKTAAGNVHLFYGSPDPRNQLTARDRLFSQDSTSVPGFAASGDGWGAALEVADLNGDGDGELIVGGVSDEGVNILAGTAAGLTGTGSVYVTQNSPGVPGGSEVDDRFGGTLQAGRFDSGEPWDLVVGAYREDIGSILNAGDVVVFKGTSATQAGYQSTGARGLSQNTTGIPDTAERNDWFGRGI